jgi:hypothetical protein
VEGVEGVVATVVEWVMEVAREEGANRAAKVEGVEEVAAGV